MNHRVIGKIPEQPVGVNQEEPLWMWDEWKKAEQSGDLGYFPQEYTGNHNGLAKADVLATKGICAVPGWSIALIEDTPMLPKQGEGKEQGGRKQLENNASAEEYLKSLSTPSYEGETGWTIEDFMTNFLTRLEETNQVSHDWNDYSALFLTGAYHSKMGYLPYGYWGRAFR